MSSSILINAFGNLAPPLAVLVASPIIAQTLGVTGRGEVAAATAPYLLAVAIATMGLPDTVTHAVARNAFAARTALRNATMLVLFAGVVATLLQLAFSPWLSSGQLNLQFLIAIAATATCPALVVSVLRGAAAGSHAWRAVAAERAIGGGARLFGIVALAVSGNLTPLSATIVFAYGPVLGGAAYLFGPRYSAGADRFGETNFTSLMSYGSKVWIGSIAGVLLLRIDQVLMTPLSSAFQLGLYAVAVNVGEVPLIVNTAVREVMFSADAARRDNSKLTAAARTSFLLCLTVGVLIATTVWWWLPIVFGSGFAAAVPVAIVLVIAVVLGTPGSIAGAGLSARGAPGLRSISLIIACVVNIGLLFVFVPAMGALGAALATLVGNLISSNLNIHFLCRAAHIRWWDFYAIKVDDARRLWRLGRSILRRSDSR